MAKKPTFNDLLLPYGSMLASYDHQVRTDLETKTDDELRAIIAATNLLTETNCWWATFEARKTVSLYAKDILHDRERKKAKADSNAR